MEEFGNEENGKIEINVRKHKGDKAELADTVFHEEFHAKHPKASERTTYKKTRKVMKELSYAEKEKLAAKVRMKKIHYKLGAAKRRHKISRSDKVEPGDMIRKNNESKPRRIAVLGLV